MPIELQIMHELQRWFAHPWAREWIIFCARWLIFFLPLGAVLAWRFKHLSRHALVEVMWSTLLAAFLAFSLEFILNRDRPFLADPLLGVLVPRPHTMSFPSAHASIAFGLAFAVLGWNARLGILAVILANLVALGRIAAGVHYPSDIVAGLLVGATAFTFVRLGHDWIRSRS